MFATDVESRMFSNDFIPVVLDEQHVAAWMLLLIVQQLYVNLSQGQATLNLAGRLAGLSELGARARDSGLLQLWNLSFVLSLISVWGIARVDGLPAWGLLGVMAAILIFHGTLVALGQHRWSHGASSASTLVGNLDTPPFLPQPLSLDVR